MITIMNGNMSNTELHNVLSEMIEHTSVMTIFEEMVTSMSTDELEENVKHLDQHLFANHFLTREDWKFDRIFNQKKEGWVIWATAGLKTQWTT